MPTTEENPISKTEWKITSERYVGYIDIMGFKDMVARTKHNEIYDIMKKIDDRKKLNENVEWNNIKEVLVRTTTYSDSIMIYSKDESADSLHSLICTIASLSDDLFTFGIPHKGAIAFGTMTIDINRSIFFGQPLIDAYLLQEELNFYGIIVHSSAHMRIEAKGAPFIFNYMCPLKNGNAYHLTISPMHGVFRNNTMFKHAYDKLVIAIKNLRFNTSGHVRKYIDNTEAYINSLPKQ